MTSQTTHSQTAEDSRDADASIMDYMGSHNLPLDCHFYNGLKKATEAGHKNVL